MPDEIYIYPLTPRALQLRRMPMADRLLVPGYVPGEEYPNANRPKLWCRTAADNHYHATSYDSLSTAACGADVRAAPYHATGLSEVAIFGRTPCPECLAALASGPEAELWEQETRQAESAWLLDQADKADDDYWARTDERLAAEADQIERKPRRVAGYVQMRSRIEFVPRAPWDMDRR